MPCSGREFPALVSEDFLFYVRCLLASALNSCLSSILQTDTIQLDGINVMRFAAAFALTFDYANAATAAPALAKTFDGA